MGYPEGSSGPYGSDLAALFFAAIFYDVANEAGMGVHKADLLFWKTISVITNSQPFNMWDFGEKVMEATRALWPDGRYTNDVADVLTSRGVSHNLIGFRDNLPRAIGSYPDTLEVASPNGFGSSHPDSQPGSAGYGRYSIMTFLMGSPLSHGTDVPPQL